MEEPIPMNKPAAGSAIFARFLALTALLLTAGAWSQTPAVNVAQPRQINEIQPAVERVDAKAAEAARIAQFLPPWPAPEVAEVPARDPLVLANGIASDTRLAAPTAEVVAGPADADEVATLEFDTPVDLWARIRHGFAMPDLDDALVRKWEQWYAARPDYVQRMTERGGRYLFHIVEEVERRGIPLEIALLPFVESAFNPEAMSRSAAAGMWQFVPATGRDFSLRQNIFRDDRRDVLASTRAALDYLAGMHSRFDDWQLALAAYNWGPGNVQRVIAANDRSGRVTTFAKLTRMPDETRNYLPKLQAIKNIISRPEAFALTLPVLANHPYFQSVAIEADIDVKLAAELADMSVESFRQLNPQMNKPVILAAGTPRILLPYDNAAAFERNLALRTAPLSSWTAWEAPRTLKPAEAARLIGMAESQLREINQIPPRMLIKVKSVLLVPRSAHNDRDVADRWGDNAMLSLMPEAQPPKLLHVKAGKKGETVAAIAARYKISVAEVVRLNHVFANAQFKPGQDIVVSVPARSAPTRLATGANKAPAKPTRLRIAAR
jgi:membrane-bound lytic murein transglycosylase D